MLKKIEPEKKKYTFSDGQEVILYAPTLLQVQNSEEKNNDIDKMVSLLVDMSRGEMDVEFIKSLPSSEFTALGEEINILISPSPKN